MPRTHPTIEDCQPSGPFLWFPGQCELEVNIVRLIQNWFPQSLADISENLHPRVAIVMAIAMARFLPGPSGTSTRPHYEVGIILTAILCDCLHFFLKWACGGDRPYWVDLTSSGQPPLNQVSHTCEGGFGFPSGHSCILACIVGAFYDVLLEVAGGKPGKKSNAPYPFFVYTVMPLVIGLSLLSMMLSCPSRPPIFQARQW